MSLDLQDLVNDRPLGKTLNRLQSHGQLFDQLRQALRIAPVSGQEGLNDEGESVEMNTLQRDVQAFTEQVRARPDYSTIGQVGTATITLTVTDSGGERAKRSFTLTVNGGEPPRITAQPQSTTATIGWAHLRMRADHPPHFRQEGR
ncbi:MAG: Ig domain-containing protein, partial [Verrucomicrobia bacterium]|nr:Ig domain-containing protein [Verrucomicrobiota bacterium]